MSTLRFTSNPLPSGGWKVSDWNAGQSSLLRWSPGNVTWNTTTETLDLTLAAAGKGSRRPFVSGEMQSNLVASTGTWSWTAQAPDLTSGSIFGLFTYKVDHFADPWIEFDFEFLGIDAGRYRDPTTGQLTVDPDGDVDGDGDVDIFQVRLNVHMETGTGQHVTLEDAHDGNGDGVQGDPIVIDLGFDATEGQHTYAVTVTASTATFTVDGRTVGSFSGSDMPQGTWTTGDMTCFVNLWCVDSTFESWAGKWAYPGTPLVGRVSGVSYAAPGGEPVLIGGPPPKPLITVQGTSASEDLRDVLRQSDVIEGAGGQDRFLFVTSPTAATRGGAAEKDVIWDFNPLAGADHDVVVISKTLAGVSQFSALYRNIKDVDGDAVLRFADGSTLRFDGLTKADLSYDDFALV